MSYAEIFMFTLKDSLVCSLYGIVTRPHHLQRNEFLHEMS